MNVTKGANSAVRSTFNACKEQQEKPPISKTHANDFTSLKEATVGAAINTTSGANSAVLSTFNAWKE